MENTDKQHAFPEHKGSGQLIDKYNINDQAHSDSSAADFIKTVSEFRHADGSTGNQPDELNVKLKNLNNEKAD